jgi:predicted nucleotidyltransferase
MSSHAPAGATSRFAGTLARLMLRTSGTPLRAAWSFAYWSVVRAAIRNIRRRYRDAAIYLKGSLATGEAVYGVSDVDLVVVLTGNAAQPGAVQLGARESWKKIAGRNPFFRLVIQHCWFHEEDDLRVSLSDSCLTHDRAVFLGGRPICDHMGLQTRPVLYGPHGDWKRLSGRDRLPPPSAEDPQARRIAAWLDLQYWWRHAFEMCVRPDSAHVPLLCVKLIAEPVRLWLWVEKGERVATRRAALLRGLSELPEERDTLELGLELLDALPRSPKPPVPEAIAALLRQTERLARNMRESVDSRGWQDVRLAGADEPVVAPGLRDRMPGAKLLPLADWRARAVPRVPDEALMLIAVSRVDPDALAAAARMDGGDVVPAICYNDVMLLPTMSPERGTLRSVHCEPTDPVSAALARGELVARFPRLAGWSAADSARRAVAEHRAWLDTDGWSTPPHGWVGVQSAPSSATARTLGLLFTAARAALFHESVADGDSELAVSISGVADRLAARDPGCRVKVENALNEFRAAKAGGDVGPETTERMLEVVRNLPAYAEAATFAMSAG